MRPASIGPVKALIRQVDLAEARAVSTPRAPRGRLGPPGARGAAAPRGVRYLRRGTRHVGTGVSVDLLIYLSGLRARRSSRSSAAPCPRHRRTRREPARGPAGGRGWSAAGSARSARGRAGEAEAAVVGRVADEDHPRPARGGGALQALGDQERPEALALAGRVHRHRAEQQRGDARPRRSAPASSGSRRPARRNRRARQRQVR